MDFSQWSKKGQEAIRSNVVGSVGLGRVIQDQIDELKELLHAYREGLIKEHDLQ